MGDPPSYTGGNRIGRRILSVSFLPDPGRERVWGIGHSRTYRLAEAPSVANTIEALVDKYGEPHVHKGLSTANFIRGVPAGQRTRAEEDTSELQYLKRISAPVFRLEKNNNIEYSKPQKQKQDI